MSATVTLHRTNDSAVKYVEVDGVTYWVSRLGESYFVARGGKVVAEVGSYNAARAAVAEDAGLVEKAPTGPTAAEVREWAKVTGRFTGTRGVLPRELFAEYEARPAGAWRTRKGHFVKRAEA